MNSKSVPPSDQPSNPAADPESLGWRERKRLQTRARIIEQALRLFLERGFEATTLDEIAGAAQISRRSFFHYFDSKEDLAFAWHDEFNQELVAAVARRPKSESLMQAAQQALLEQIDRYDHTEALALARLVHDTPALRAREQAKHESKELALGSALIGRLPRSAKPADALRARMVAMIVVGSLRVAGEAWLAEGGRSRPHEFIVKAFRTLGEAVGTSVAVATRR